MNTISRIKTRRSLAERIALTVWYSAQKSWYPALCFYAVLLAAVFAINYQG